MSFEVLKLIIIDSTDPDHESKTELIESKILNREQRNSTFKDSRL